MAGRCDLLRGVPDDGAQRAMQPGGPQALVRRRSGTSPRLVVVTLSLTSSPIVEAVKSALFNLAGGGAMDQ